MTSFKFLIENNIQCLVQGINLLTDLEDAVYVHTQAPAYTSCIGDHYRHCLEHYISFLDGLEALSSPSQVDYDARKRDKRIATQRDYAIEITNNIITRMGRLVCEGEVIQVKIDCRLDGEEGAVWAGSTPERDLQYLQAHTIHHYALIAMIARLQGVEPGEQFGMAPSTLTYKKHQSQTV